MEVKNIAIIIVRNSKEEYLIHKRKPNEFFGMKYGLGAGGKIEPSESPIEGAKRELEEELGIKTDIKQIFSFPYSHSGISYTVYVFEAVYDKFSTSKEWEWAGFVPKEIADILEEKSLFMPDTKIAYQKYVKINS